MIFKAFRAKRGRKSEALGRFWCFLSFKSEAFGEQKQPKASKAKLLAEGRGRSEASLPVPADLGRFRRKQPKMPENGPKWSKNSCFWTILGRFWTILIDFRWKLSRKLIFFSGSFWILSSKMNFLFRPKNEFSMKIIDFYFRLEICFSTHFWDVFDFERHHFRKCRTRHRHEITLFGIDFDAENGWFWSSQKRYFQEVICFKMMWISMFHRRNIMHHNWAEIKLKNSYFPNGQPIFNEKISLKIRPKLV